MVVYGGSVSLPKWINSIENISSQCTTWNLLTGRIEYDGNYNISLSIFAPTEVTPSKENFYINIKGSWK